MKKSVKLGEKGDTIIIISPKKIETIFKQFNNIYILRDIFMPEEELK